jgi:hypothetical protein
MSGSSRRIRVQKSTSVSAPSTLPRVPIRLEQTPSISHRPLLSTQAPFARAPLALPRARTTTTMTTPATKAQFAATRTVRTPSTLVKSARFLEPFDSDADEDNNIVNDNIKHRRVQPPPTLPRMRAVVAFDDDDDDEEEDDENGDLVPYRNALFLGVPSINDDGDDIDDDDSDDSGSYEDDRRLPQAPPTLARLGSVRLRPPATLPRVARHSFVYDNNGDDDDDDDGSSSESLPVKRRRGAAARKRKSSLLLELDDEPSDDGAGAESDSASLARAPAAIANVRTMSGRMSRPPTLPSVTPAPQRKRAPRDKNAPKKPTQPKASVQYRDADDYDAAFDVPDSAAVDTSEGDYRPSASGTTAAASAGDRKPRAAAVPKKKAPAAKRKRAPVSPSVAVKYRPGTLKHRSGARAAVDMENQEYGGDDALEAPPPAKRAAAVVVDERNIDEDDDAIDLLMPRTRVDTPRKSARGAKAKQQQAAKPSAHEGDDDNNDELVAAAAAEAVSLQVDRERMDPQVRRNAAHKSRLRATSEAAAAPAKKLATPGRSKSVVTSMAAAKRAVERNKNADGDDDEDGARSDKGDDDDDDDDDENDNGAKSQQAKAMAAAEAYLRKTPRRSAATKKRLVP